MIYGSSLRLLSPLNAKGPSFRNFSSRRDSVRAALQGRRAETATPRVYQVNAGEEGRHDIHLPILWPRDSSDRAVRWMRA